MYNIIDNKKYASNIFIQFQQTLSQIIFFRFTLAITFINPSCNILFKPYEDIGGNHGGIQAVIFLVSYWIYPFHDTLTF